MLDTSSPTLLQQALVSEKRLLFIHTQDAASRATLLSRGGKHWSVSWAMEVPEIIPRKIMSAVGDQSGRPLRGPIPVLVASSSVPVLTLPLPSGGLSEAELAETLRWDAESIMPESMLPLRLAWCPDASGNALLAVPVSHTLCEDWHDSVSASGHRLLGIVPEIWIAYKELCRLSTEGPVMLWQPRGSGLGSALLREGKVEAALFTQWHEAELSRGPRRDATAAGPGVRHFTLAGGEADPSMLLLDRYQLPHPALLWQHTTWPNCVEMTFNSGGWSLPWLDLRSPPVAMHKRPIVWWATMAAALLAAAGWPLFTWSKARTAEETQLATLAKETTLLEQKLSAKQQAQAEFARLQQELTALESQISQAQRSGLASQQAVLADAAFVEHFLTQVALAFSARGRIRQLMLTCDGEVQLKGTTDSDVQAQGALALFLTAMEAYPQLKPLLLSTIADSEQAAADVSSDAAGIDFSTPALRFSAETKSQISSPYFLNNRQAAE